MAQLNSAMVLPMANDHYGFRHKDRDFQGRRHPGYDYNGPGGGGADLGTPLVACAPGIVTFRADGKNRGWGNMVIYKVDMEQFFLGFGLDRPDWCPERLWIRYAHCSEIFVQEGDQIETGGQIATLGGTGGWSPHLHWDMKKVANGPMHYPAKSVSEEEFDRIYLDPEQFIAAVNEYITTAKEMNGKEPKARLIKYSKDPKVYYFNGKVKFYIPDWFTFSELFGDEEIEEVTKAVLKGIPTGQPIPSLKP